MTFFNKAYSFAELAFHIDEVPVGAVIVHDNKIIASYPNLMRTFHDATAHAEILCIQKACEILKTQHLSECDLYVTLEPCPMCAGAIAQSKIRRVYFGAYDMKGGGVEHGPQIFKSSLHKPEVIGGIEEEKVKILMSLFFKNKR